jgi:hypothetical protein
MRRITKQIQPVDEPLDISQAALYHHFRAREFHSGAMAYSFVPRFTLPVHSLIGGFPVAELQLPGAPSIISAASVQNGLGGIVAGQMMLQPLLVPGNGGGGS